MTYFGLTPYFSTKLNLGIFFKKGATLKLGKILLNIPDFYFLKAINVSKIEKV